MECDLILKRFTILLLCLCIFFLSSCSYVGDVSNVEIITVESKYFTQDEILEAIEIVKTEFVDFDGCTLVKVGYVGDEKLVENIVGNKHENPQFIVLDCEFKTSITSASEGFNAYETYEYGWWKWYLSKDDAGNWIIDTYGLG